MLNEARENMRKEAIEDIIDVLEDYEGYYCDLHNEVFNTGYYIIGTYEAKQQLEKLGVFEAIEEVQQYEMDNFGEVYTDLSDPEKLINMLYYIIGEEVISDIDIWNGYWDKEAVQGYNNALIEILKEELI